MNHQKRAGLYIDELLRELETSAQDEVSLRHPMAFGEVFGRGRVEELAAAAESIFSEVEPDHTWSGADIGGREWHGHFQGRRIRGVTVARRFDKHVQVDIFLASFPVPVRQALHDACRDLIDADAWLLPPGIDTALPPIPADEVLDAKLQFGLAADVLFTSPVACKPVRGVADVERLCGHSIVVYGGRASGPRLTSGSTTLSIWTGQVAGLPLEVANVIHWEDAQHVKVMAMAMRPWPVVALFQARMQARTLSFLDASYFESDDGTTPLQLDEEV
ncbi:hypothetical protein BCF11_2463 [Collimonas sp. PA-H2]|uniref:hypothetical protein n=1 Tax=Collimonas sp. PA-H2 TaxID=1881062 RepID=UPI000BF395A5|nr:hypothetical protein [Collimonas sp. PA-H2]PFH10056.1 hypothetical protein BCF11_2463 [Collimonas sp. PA-H2]